MAFQNGRPRKDRFDAASRTRFFEVLAITANVSESARQAGVSSGAVYRERARSAVFRQSWVTALSEGYARLEADMLAEALRRPNGKAKEATERARAARVRLATTLLAAHRATVRGERREEPQVTGIDRAPAAIRERLKARFADMRTRKGMGTGVSA